jgi:F-type H+-transporting ATPase subunit b
MNEQILIVLAEEERGGGFDFGATLPLMAVQFLLLMFILNLVLYTPLLTLMNKRNEYIVSNLAKASEILAQANQLTSEYEEELAKTKKQAQQELLQSQNAQKASFNTELSLAQKSVETLIQEVLTNFESKKKGILDTLEADITSLSSAIYQELFLVAK